MKAVKTITIILLIVLITMIGFFGIYSQELNFMKNKMEEYKYSKNLEGKRIVRLSVSDGTYDIIKDNEGKIVPDSENLTEEQIVEKGYVKEEIKYNNDEQKVKENYVLSKQIIEKRLEESSVHDYLLRLDEVNGDIVVELTEDENTDFVLSNMYAQGNFEIVDTNTNEVLMDNNDLKDVSIAYAQSQSGVGTETYLMIKFDKEGKQKLEDITNKYHPIKEEKVEEKVEENQKVDETDETTQKEEPVKNSITMKVDNTDIMTTEFEEPIKTGELSLSMGKAATDEETLNNNIRQATSMATIMKNGEMPLVYDVTENEFIKSNISEEKLMYVVYAVLVLLAIVFVIFTIKYKLAGALSTFAIIGLISIYSLILRYTNVIISIEGIVGIIAIILLQIVFLNKLLSKIKNEVVYKMAIRQTYKEIFSILIPVIIMSITFAFMKFVPVSSLGMIMFWGIVVIASYNITITNLLLKISLNK